jgi:hypothetical protein
MVLVHEPRVAVRAAITDAPQLDFSAVSHRLRFLLERANVLLGRPLSPEMLELLQRASVVTAHMIDRGFPLTVQGIRDSIAPADKKQPPRGQVPSRAIGNDTVRSALSNDVARVVDLAIQLGWFAGDYLMPTAVTVFSTWAPAGRASHALAVSGGTLPILGTGIGSFDTFIVNAIVELVYGTRHDPQSAIHEPDEIAEMLELWGHAAIDEMPLLHFERAFEQVIAHEAKHRRLFEGVASAEELGRGCPRDIVASRLPHGPWDKRLRMPAGEIMCREHDAMVTTVEKHGYRGVLAYSEDRIDPTNLRVELERLSGVNSPDIHRVKPAELVAFQNERGITVDMLHVGHYVLIGRNENGTLTRRIARHAFDDRVTIFETVGFDENTMHEAVALADYATANELRRSCIDRTMRKRAKPGSLGASNPEVRAGLRRLALLVSAVTVGLSRRAQASLG